MMARTRVCVAALFVAACGITVRAEAAGKSDPVTRPARDRDKRKPPQYVVVEVGNTVGEIKYEVISNSDFSDRRKECAALHKEALREWNQAKDEAKKNREKFTEKRPVAPYVKKVSDLFASEEEARACAQKLRDRQSQPAGDDPSTPPGEPKKAEEKKGDKPQS